ncbi:MAG: oligosaccharide flippase family protein [Pseudomonadota bacterium]
MVMMTHTSDMRGARLRPLLVLLSGNSAIAALTLMRNLIAARLIGLDQFGIAAALAIVATGVEMVSNLGLAQILVRDQRGAWAKFQASLHFVQIVRGLFCALLLYALAPWIAELFNLSSATWAFRLIALLPLMAGFLHLDVFRYQRDGRFGPSLMIGFGPALLALVMIWPLFQTFGDFRILLFASLIQGGAMLVMSHLTAQRRFAICVETRHWRSIWLFGAPIAMNGFLLLGVFHGEKIIVAHLLGPSQLALIAMGFTLTLTPALVLGRSLQTYALPKLSRLTSGSGFRRSATHLMVVCAATALGATATLWAAAPAIPLILGPDFSALQPLFPLLAVLHGLRILRAGPSIIALSQGNSVNAVLGNLPRVAALPVCYVWLADGGSLAGLLWIAIVAEACGLALSYAKMRQSLHTV